MAQDQSTKVLLGIVVLLAIVGVFFLMREGGYQYPGRESPGQFGWTGECCTCTRAMQTPQGAVRPETREVLFRNEHVPDCAAACTQMHEYTKQPYVKYDVNAFVSNDAQCRTSMPAPLTYAGGGGFSDQPSQDRYYITS
jgi:hypothetical protein